MNQKIEIAGKNSNKIHCHIHLCSNSHVPSLDKAAAQYFALKKEQENDLIPVADYPHLHLYVIVPSESGCEAVKRLGSRVWAWIQAGKHESCLMHLHGVEKEAGQWLAEGILLSSYRFDKYKATKKNAQTHVSLVFASGSITQAGIADVMHRVKSIFAVRDLVNEPYAGMHAVQLAKSFERMGKEFGFKVEVLTKSRIEALKMAGLLTVNKGSKHPPTFTVMEYCHPSAKKSRPLVLVGKGVVYDTGGYNIKVGNGMETMKCDMAGAAAVAGIIATAAAKKLPVHLVALVPSTDNFVSSHAYVAGDIITYSNGVSAEVLNTDAEGRLILADALIYAKRFKPSLVIDFATLTGAAAAAIGKYGAVAMANKAGEENLSALEKAGDESGDRIAKFPFWEDYAELIKSETADIKNIGGPYAGAITAGKFLERFTDYPWIHVDIAGPAFIEADWNYRKRGGTGFGVALMDAFVKHYKAPLAKKSEDKKPSKK